MILELSLLLGVAVLGTGGGTWFFTHRHYLLRRRAIPDYSKIAALEKENNIPLDQLAKYVAQIEAKVEAPMKKGLYPATKPVPINPPRPSSIGYKEFYSKALLDGLVPGLEISPASVNYRADSHAGFTRSLLPSDWDYFHKLHKSGIVEVNGITHYDPRYDMVTIAGNPFSRELVKDAVANGTFDQLFSSTVREIEARSEAQHTTPLQLEEAVQSLKQTVSEVRKSTRRHRIRTPKPSTQLIATPNETPKRSPRRIQDKIQAGSSKHQSVVPSKIEQVRS